VTARRRAEPCMGTVFSFDVRGTRADDIAIDHAVALLHDIDATFSTYRADSVITRLSRGEIQLDATTPEVRHVLAECVRWEQATDGWFNAYAAGVLDPSGYVKGWAIQRASDVLRDAGSTRHCVNGGGDVQCTGGSSPGQPWRVGIADPRDRTKLISTVAGTDLAVATSGSAERGAHILDPFTGEPPVTPLLSLTVIGRSVIECDVYATAGFAMGAAAYEWLMGLPHVQAFAVGHDGRTWSTSRLALRPRGAGDGNRTRTISLEG
jgi:thiamine biosynthesis lipoprotein